MCLLIGEFGKIINVCMFKNIYFTGNKQGAVSDQNGEIFWSLNKCWTVSPEDAI